MRLAAATLAAFALTAGAGSASTPAPNRVQVTAKEFYYVVPPHTVPEIGKPWSVWAVQIWSGAALARLAT